MYFSFRLGSNEARLRFPRVLQLLCSTTEAKYLDVESEFTSMCKQIPSWMFISWISQMVSLLDKREAGAVNTILLDIATRYGYFASKQASFLDH